MNGRKSLIETIIRHGGLRLLTFNALVLNCGLSSCEWKSQKQQFLPGWSTTEAAVSESSPYRVSLSRWNIQSVLAHPDNASSRGFSAIQANLSTPFFFFFACGSEELISWTAVSCEHQMNISDLPVCAWARPKPCISSLLTPAPEHIHEESQALRWRFLTEARMKQVSTIAKYFLQGALKRRRPPGSYIINYISNVNNSTKRSH